MFDRIFFLFFSFTQTDGPVSHTDTNVVVRHNFLGYLGCFVVEMHLSSPFAISLLSLSSVGAEYRMKKEKKYASQQDGFIGVLRSTYDLEVHENQRH